MLLLGACIFKSVPMLIGFFIPFTDPLGCKWTFQMKLAFWVFGCEYCVLHIKNAVGSPCWQGLKRFFFQERNLRVRCLLKIQWKRTRAYGVKTASNTLWIKQILIWIYCCIQKGFRAHIYIYYFFHSRTVCFPYRGDNKNCEMAKKLYSDKASQTKMFYSMTLCRYLWRDKKNSTAIFQCEATFFLFFFQSPTRLIPVHPLTK